MAAKKVWNMAGRTNTQSEYKFLVGYSHFYHLMISKRANVMLGSTYIG